MKQSGQFPITMGRGNLSIGMSKTFEDIRKEAWHRLLSHTCLASSLFARSCSHLSAYVRCNGTMYVQVAEWGLKLPKDDVGPTPTAGPCLNRHRPSSSLPCRPPGRLSSGERRRHSHPLDNLVLSHPPSHAAVYLVNSIRP